MSGIVRDAENRARLPNGTAACSALESPVNSELVWKNGSGAYDGRSRAELGDAVTCIPVRANRPCVQRTAFGNPVEPDVKIRR